MKRRYGLSVAILASFLVSGCGQKGPLFLPGDRDIQTELPEMDREALEEALDEEGGDDEDGSRDDPESVRPETGEDEAEPFIDPASPPSRQDDQRT